MSCMACELYNTQVHKLARLSVTILQMFVLCPQALWKLGMWEEAFRSVTTNLIFPCILVIACNAFMTAVVYSQQNWNALLNCGASKSFLDQQSMEVALFGTKISTQQLYGS